MRTHRTRIASVILLATVGIFISAGEVLGQGEPLVPVFKSGSASDSPKLVFAERGGVPNQFIALLAPGPRPVPTEAVDLVKRFGGQVLRAWESCPPRFSR